MKTKFLKFKNWLMLSLAGIFGLQLACSSHNPHNEPKCIYGPPEMLNGWGDHDDSDNIIPEEDQWESDSKKEDVDDGFTFDNENSQK